ncbi:hypothetical protein ACFLZI_02265, partial [Nitrospirota bacterium]
MPGKGEIPVERIAKDVVNQLAAIIRTAQIHDPGNVAVMKSIERLVALLAYVFKSGESAKLELVGEYFYMSETRVKFAMEQLMNFDYLAREMKKLKLGSVTFDPGVSATDIQAFLRAFIAASFSKSPYDDLANDVAAIEHVSVAAPRKEKDEEVVQDTDMRKTVKNTYFNAVSYTKGVMNKMQTGEKVNVKRAKRVVQSMVDLLLSEEELML